MKLKGKALCTGASPTMATLELLAKSSKPGLMSPARNLWLAGASCRVRAYSLVNGKSYMINGVTNGIPEVGISSHTMLEDGARKLMR